MSEKREDTRNLSELEIREIEEIQINEFHPLPEGQGDPTQVHLAMKLKDAPANLLLILRLKSRRACVELIEALTTHTNNVFPVPDVDFAKKGSGKTGPMESN